MEGESPHLEPATPALLRAANSITRLGRAPRGGPRPAAALALAFVTCSRRALHDTRAARGLGNATFDRDGAGRPTRGLWVRDAPAEPRGRPSKACLIEPVGETCRCPDGCPALTSSTANSPGTRRSVRPFERSPCSSTTSQIRLGKRDALAGAGLALRCCGRICSRSPLLWCGETPRARRRRNRRSRGRRSCVGCD